jgi:hypothetical protein
MTSKSGSRTEKVFYPVFPTEEHPAEVIAWLQNNPKPAD